MLRRNGLEAEWYDGLSKVYGGLEVVPAYLFHTRKWTGDQRMEFFGGIRDHSTIDTNMYQDSFLPNPMSFLVEGIRIFGLTTEMLGGGARFRLIIGNRFYDDGPAVMYTMNENRLWRPAIPRIPLAIMPLCYFRGELSWRDRMMPFPVPVITVVLRGKMARATQ